MIIIIWHGYTTPENAGAYEIAVLPGNDQKIPSRCDGRSQHYDVRM